MLLRNFAMKIPNYGLSHDSNFSNKYRDKLKSLILISLTKFIEVLEDSRNLRFDLSTLQLPQLCLLFRVPLFSQFPSRIGSIEVTPFHIRQCPLDRI
jgi:hypothetical protein